MKAPCLRCAVVLLLCTVHSVAPAQPVETATGTYPSRPVRFLIPVPPGGGADLIGRLVGQKLSENWGQMVVIDNRGGASGTIAVDTAAKAPPDGHTIVMSLIASFTVAPVLSKLPYDPVADFAPVTMLAVAQNILVVHPSVPATNVKELVAVLRAKPGQYHYASAGSGTSPHLSAELFKIMTGVQMNHVPYKGAGPALVDLMSGQVSVYFGSIPATLPAVKSGKLRMLAASGSQRSVMLPDVPTIAEAGVPGFESMQWYGVMAPVRTPAWIVEKLNRDIVGVLKQPDIRERLLAQGFEVIGNSREEFGRYIKLEITKWAKVVKQAGIRAD